MKIIEQIKQDLVQNGCIEKTINYSEFCDIYKPYINLLPEDVFATEVLQLTYTNFFNMKSSGTNARIHPYCPVNKSVIRLIKKEMKKIFSNSKLHYDTFLKIYENYKNLMSEIDFAKNIFEIRKNSFSKFKKGQVLYLKVFKNSTDSFLKYYKILYDQLYLKYSGHKILYDEFKEIHMKYAPDLAEEDFAECVGISFSVYSKMRKDRKKQTILFNISKAEYENVNVADLFDKYRNKFIDYDEFKSLYNEYGLTLSENQFARFLGIGGGYFSNFKLKNNKVQILKKALSEEEKSQILHECKINGLTRRKIDYKYFLELYSKYKKLMSEIEFSELIGITNETFGKMKYANKKGLALKNIQKTEVLEIMKIENKKLDGNYIGYNDFQRLYFRYSDYVEEREFSSMLGIGLTQYYSIRGNSERKVRVNYYLLEEKIIKHRLKDKGKYEICDFEQLTSDIEINLEMVFKILYGKIDMELAEKYYNALKNNGYLVVSHCPLSDVVAYETAEYILQECSRISKILCIKFFCVEIYEDISSNAVSYIINNCGDFEQNFGNDWLSICIPYIFGVMKKECQKYLKGNMLLQSLDKCVNDRISKNAYDFLADKRDQFEFSEEYAGECTSKDLYSQVLTAIKIGMENYDLNATEVITKFAKLRNIETENLIELLKKQTLAKNIIKKDSKGKFMLS
jgi:Rio2, N-terminal.